MQAKALEIRDKGTFIPCLAVNMNPVEERSDMVLEAHAAQKYLLRRCGYPCDGHPNVIVTRLDGNGTHAFNDYYAHEDRTWRIAHQHIYDNWNWLKDGDVVDVEFILGETETSKISERYKA